MTDPDILNIAAATLGSFISGGAIVLALGNWLGKVWAARILERDRAHFQTVMASTAQEAQRTLEQLKGELQKRALVHRVQFEAEFRAYQEIWAALIPAISATLKLRPIVDEVPERTSEEQRRKERFETYRRDFDGFLTAAQTHRPFLPVAVDIKVQKLVRLLWEEEISFQDSEDLDVGYWEKHQIKEQRDRICEAIRDRIGILEVAAR